MLSLSHRQTCTDNSIAISAFGRQPVQCYWDYSPSYLEELDYIVQTVLLFPCSQSKTRHPLVFITFPYFWIPFLRYSHVSFPAWLPFHSLLVPNKGISGSQIVSITSSVPLQVLLTPWKLQFPVTQMPPHLNRPQYIQAFRCVSHNWPCTLLSAIHHFLLTIGILLPHSPILSPQSQNHIYWLFNISYYADIYILYTPCTVTGSKD